MRSNGKVTILLLVIGAVAVHLVAAHFLVLKVGVEVEVIVRFFFVIPVVSVLDLVFVPDDFFLTFFERRIGLYFLLNAGIEFGGRDLQ